MLKEYLGLIVLGRDLTRAEAQAAMHVIMSGEATESQIGAFLMALRLKGETVEEIAGFATTMRQHAANMSCHSTALIDTCGTGGDCKGTFNVSTTAAFVLAGAGLSVAKHGNKGMTSSCGSADLLEALGIEIQLSPPQAASCIDQVGIGFMFAPLFHGAMKYAAKTRRDLGFRTVFNILGPLTNPAGAECQLMGIYDPALTEKVATTLAVLGTKRAMVVHSQDGMDEISTAAPTRISEVRDGKVSTYILNPADYGFAAAPADAYIGGSIADNALITTAILSGEAGYKRDIVVMNAAAGLVVGGLADDLADGIKQAAAVIDSGAALAKLNELRAYSHSCKEGLLS